MYFIDRPRLKNCDFSLEPRKLMHPNINENKCTFLLITIWQNDNSCNQGIYLIFNDTKAEKNSFSYSCVNNFRTLSMKCMNKSIRYQKAQIHCSYLVKSINITFVVQRFLRHQQVNGKCFVNVWDYCPHIKIKSIISLHRHRKNDV